MRFPQPTVGREAVQVMTPDLSSREGFGAVAAAD